MASGFPGSIDSFTNPLTTSPLNSPSHAGQHQDLNDAVNKIETYMGLVKVIPTGATNGTVSADGDVTVGSAVSAVFVFGAFSALYDHYKIIYSGGSASTASDLALRLGSSTTGYYENMIYRDWGGGGILGQAVTNGAQWSYVGCQDNPNHIAIDIYNPFNAAKTGFSGNYLGIGTGRVGGVLNGFLNDTTSYTSFTVITSGGAGGSTITGGTIRVYGYRN
jgi:hypothetical protein